MKNKTIPLDADEDFRRLFNRTCREDMKRKLLADIRLDMAICELEGWNALEYLDSLLAMLYELRYRRTLPIPRKTKAVIPHKTTLSR